MDKENEIPQPAHVGCRRYMPAVIGGAYCPHCERLEAIDDYRDAVERFSTAEDDEQALDAAQDAIDQAAKLVGELETLTLEEATRDAANQTHP